MIKPSLFVIDNSLRFIILSFTCVWCVQVPLHARDISFALELKLQIAERCLTWVLGTQLGASGRAGNTFNYGPITLASLPRLSLFNLWLKNTKELYLFT